MSREMFTDFPGQLTLTEYESMLHERLAKEHYEWAKGLVRLFVKESGSGVAYETEELEGVALFALAKAIREYDPQTVAFRTFASRVIQNELTDHMRCYSKKSLKTIALDDIAFLEDPESAERLEQDLEVFLGNNKSKRLRLGLFALKMRFLGLRMKELEKRTGIPVDKWYRWIKEAKKELKMQMKKK